MTPEERAEKLRWMFWNPAMETNRALSLIAAQIREAEKKARNQIGKHYCDESYERGRLTAQDMVKVAWQEGFNAAKEKAIEIAESMSYKPKYQKDEAMEIADRIREMEAE